MDGHNIGDAKARLFKPIATILLNLRIGNCALEPHGHHIPF
jgi:hypothetical protein